MTSKIDYDAETRSKNRGPKAHENWTRGQAIQVLASSCLPKVAVKLKLVLVVELLLN